MADDIPADPTNRFCICNPDDSYSMDNKNSRCADRNIRTSPNRKRNSLTSRSMDYTSSRNPRYTGGDNNICLATVDTDNPFHIQLHFQRDTTKDILWYILRKLLEV
jgi:hypothetical protein